jgi:hypothetical protein
MLNPHKLKIPHKVLLAMLPQLPLFNEGSRMNGINI